MKALFLSVFLVIGLDARAQASISAEKKTTIVMGVIAAVPRAEFSSKFESLLENQWRNCSHCEIKNLTPYKEDGQLDRAALPGVLGKVPGQVQVLYWGWNEALGPNNRDLLEALKKVTKENVVLVGTAGEASGNDPSHSLTKTLIGQVPDAIIIGELNERDSLVRRSFYGPEMLTALKAPAGFSGQGVAPSVFAARLTKEWNKKSADQWMSHFRARKSLSRRLWPGLDELFGR